MIYANLLFYLLLPHALGTTSGVVGQIALCLLLFFNGLFLLKLPSSAIYTKRPEALPQFVELLVVPASIVVLLANFSRPEQWTLHAAILLLPMALTPTAAAFGELSETSKLLPETAPALELPSTPTFRK